MLLQHEISRRQVGQAEPKKPSLPNLKQCTNRIATLIAVSKACMAPPGGLVIDTGWKNWRALN